MPHELRLPALDEAKSEGMVVTWFKAPGERVRKGEVLLEVQVEKVACAVECPVDGTLTRILAEPGATVAVGQVLALITEAGEAAPEDAPRAPASPAARRLARELAVNLAAVTGSGPEGRITEADIRLAAESAAGGGAPAPAPSPLPGVKGSWAPLGPEQRTVATRMLSSLQGSAQLTLGREVDVTDLLAVRETDRQQGRPQTLTDLLHRAVVLALADHPRLQAIWAADRLFIPEEVNLGFAVDREEAGLLVPVIPGALRMNLAELAAARELLTEAALAGRLTAEQQRGGTFTVTNLGPAGVDFFTPILNPPQTAILGAGRTVRRPGWDAAGQVAPRQYLTLSLTVDHRVVNGAPAAAFLARLAELLEQPEPWAVPG